MDRTACLVPFQARKTKALRHHTLTGKRRIAMDQQRQNLDPLVRITKLVLLCTHLAQHHRVDDFEMRRICGQRQMHIIAVKCPVG